jgi:deazaflavin-dependent oxidoreductase (nitroreductase family)
MQLDATRRVFRTVNRYFMVPIFRLGLGSVIVNPFSGYIMVLKTIGFKSGRTRYAPVNYAIQEGNVYCMAGFGPITHWYRNLRANPSVELLMPGGNIKGIAEPVTDPGERLRALRQILKNGGLAGFSMGFNPHTAPDEQVIEKCEGLPVIRIRPAGITRGAADPGGWLWLLWAGVAAAPILMRWFGKKRSAARLALYKIQITQDVAHITPERTLTRT